MLPVRPVCAHDGATQCHLSAPSPVVPLTWGALPPGAHPVPKDRHPGTLVLTVGSGSFPQRGDAASASRAR
ncbi:hypothetical protein KR76_00127 [Pimelobacter simplex]|uniref:Uncharacterized protein n=1 Tax=Nocardioides simplex TaxID=2045 RepID=A0A0C5XCP0_NOCSI|nr:hypothetical protein KR76_00127 [Pimelobacter simplex]